MRSTARSRPGGMATVHFGRLLGPGRLLADGRHQAPPPAVRQGSRVRLDVPRRGAARARIQHPNVVPTLDVVAARRRALPRHGVRARRVALRRLIRAMRAEAKRIPLDDRLAAIICGALHGLHAAHEATDEHGQAARHRPPRRVPAEHPRRRRRRAARPRLRRRQGAGPAADDARGAAERQARLHGARAAPSAARRSPDATSTRRASSCGKPLPSSASSSSRAKAPSSRNPRGLGRAAQRALARDPSERRRRRPAGSAEKPRGQVSDGIRDGHGARASRTTREPVPRLGVGLATGRRFARPSRAVRGRGREPLRRQRARGGPGGRHARGDAGLAPARAGFEVATRRPRRDLRDPRDPLRPRCRAPGTARDPREQRSCGVPRRDADGFCPSRRPASPRRSSRTGVPCKPCATATSRTRPA